MSTDPGAPELRPIPEVRYSQIAGGVKGFAQQHGLDLASPQSTSAGEWQMPSGERVNIYAGMNRLVGYTGNQEHMKQWVISVGERPDEKTLKYTEGPSNLFGTGMEPKLGWYGKAPFLESAGRSANTDVFEPTEAFVDGLKAAQKVSP